MIITHNGTILKHDGTILTKITEVPPQPPFTNTYSLDFDGVDDYVDCGDSDTFSFGNGSTDSPFSISAWINMDDASAFRIANKYTNTDREYIFTTDSSDRLSFALYDLSSGGRIQRKYNTALTSFQGQWINVVGTYDGNSLSSGILLYLNGTRVDDLDGNLGSYTAMENTTQPFEIGRNNLTSFANGKIDELSVFDKALTPTEITSISSAPTDLSDLSPVAWYRMGDNGSWKSPQWLIPNNENKDKVSNYSFEFDGIDDYIDIGNEINFEYNDAFSYSFWVNPDVVSGPKNLYTKYDSGRGIYFYINSSGAANANVLYFLLLNTNSGSISTRKRITTNTGAIISPSVWTNIVITYDGSGLGSGINVYKNGVSQTVTITQDNLQNNTILNSSDSYIGAFNGTSSFLPGKQDEFSIYNSELSSDDALTIYSGGEPTTISGAVAYYKMGEEANFTSNWLVNNSALDNYSKRSFEFDGIGDKVELGTQSLGITGAISVSAWVKIPTTNTGGGGTNIQQIVCEDRAGGTGRNWLLYWRGGGSNLFSCAIFDSLGTSKSASSTAVLPNDGNWHHVMFTYAGDTSTNGLKLFVDGILRSQATSVNGGLRSSPTIKPTIGGLSNVITWMFEGNIDEVSIFNTDQSANVSTIYNSGIPNDLTELSPLHWYRMGEDASFNGTNWTVPDNVGSNNGTSANMTVDALVGEAPNYSGGGISNGMTIEDRVGESPNSENNALSFNMESVDRTTDVPT